MNNMLIIAAEAARQVQATQAVVTHNLANVSTTAFKADLYNAEAQYLRTGMHAGNSIAREGLASVDYAPGNIQATGKDLDIAITGAGWFKVIADDGTEALSRRGDLRVDLNGQMTDATGYPIMGEGGPIALPPYSQMTIGTDGTISIVPLGEPPTSIVAIDRIALVNPPVETITKGGDGLYRTNNINVSDLEPDANIKIAVGSLEMSNVNPVQAMVQMIELAESHNRIVKSMKTADELDTSSSSLMKLE